MTTHPEARTEMTTARDTSGGEDRSAQETSSHARG
jgi:hypothetical protein